MMYPRLLPEYEVEEVIDALLNARALIVEFGYTEEIEQIDRALDTLGYRDKTWFSDPNDETEVDDE